MFSRSAKFLPMQYKIYKLGKYVTKTTNVEVLLGPIIAYLKFTLAQVSRAISLDTQKLVFLCSNF